MKKLFLLAFAAAILNTSCTQPCLRCECRSWLGCTNPYDTSSKTTRADVSFCDGENGVDDSDFDDIEEEMIDKNWKCTNS